MPEIEPTSQPLSPQRILDASYVILDFETTMVSMRGLNFPEPIELAAMRVGPGLSVEQAPIVDSLIEPPSYAPVLPWITELTGISQADVAGAPKLETVLRALNLDLNAQPALLVAQYAPFDAGVIWRFVEHCPAVARTSFLDTVELARRLRPGLRNYKLHTIAESFDVFVPPKRHRALIDVQITVEIFVRLMRIALDQGLTDLDEIKAIGGLETPHFRTTRFQEKLL